MKQFDLKEYLANPSRKVVTRDGRKARIICTDRRNLNYPIIALIETRPGEEMAYSHTKDGKHCVDCSDIFDLFFAPEKHEGWVNIYKGNNFYYTEDELVYNSKKEAEIQGKNYMSYIDTVKVEWEE